TRAIRQGVPAHAVVADGYWVTSTYSEAVQLKEFIARSEAPIHSVIVSSDAYHMRRARWAYRQVLGDQVEVQMAPVPFELSPYQRQWWSSRRSCKRVLEEYAKTVYYVARYKLFRGPIREWLAALDRD
ncbi:MAG: YdcF family protein, partial [Anaerolineae bacterium]